jgi:hypothetical protein
MAIYISLKKNEKTSLADRITSTIQFSKRLLSQYNFMESSAKIYELVRIEQDSETFDVEDLNVGQKIANRIASLKRSSYGVVINGKIYIDSKIFHPFIDILPPNRSQYYDFIIDVYENAYASTLEDLNKYTNLYERIEKIILSYNKEYKSNKNLLEIKTAIVSDYFKQYHDIKDWTYFFSKNVEELILLVFFNDKDLKNRLYYANRQRIAKTLFNFDGYRLAIAKAAQTHKVAIKTGSISLSPQKEDAMKGFVNEITQITKKLIKTTNVTKEEQIEKYEKALKEINY